MANTTEYDFAADRLAFGANGFIEIENGTSLSAEDRFAVLEADVETIFSFDNDVNNGILTSASYILKEGAVRYGNFHNIVVASGKLIAYYQ